MERHQREALRENRAEIVKEMQNVDAVLDQLNSANVIGDLTRERIGSESTRANKVRAILDYIVTRPNSFDTFLEVMLLTENYSVRGFLDPLYTAPPTGIKTKSNPVQSTKPSSSPTAAESKCYPMTKKPRGLALIISMNDVVGHKQRTGVERDDDKLAQLTNHLLLRRVHKRDLTGQALRGLVQQFLDPSKHVGSQCFMLVVMSHGEDDFILASDGEKIHVQRELVEPFQECKALTGVPKLFFIQACRSRVAVDGPERTLPSSDATDSTPLYLKKPLQSGSDVLIGWATVGGQYAIRDTETGSWYIQTLADVFLKEAASEDVLSLMTKVNLRVSEKQSSLGMNIPRFESSLRDKLYLRPGLFESGE